ncbi:hypothetical protein HY631_01210, partial [Candidatus Uhrbacteria bacterium]|nr:hypothetical protein [Candidatus Uhrbacteria bacterium]
ATAHLTSNGTGTAAVDIDATGTGGDIDMDANDDITIDAGDAFSIDGAGVSSNVTLTSDGAAQDFTVSLAGAFNSSLILSSAGTAADALQISTSAGGMDITVAGGGAGENLDVLSDQGLTFTSTKSMTTAILIDSSTNNSGIRIIAGDNEPTAIGDGNDVEILAEDDLLFQASDDIIFNAVGASGKIEMTVADTVGIIGNGFSTLVTFRDVAADATVADFDGQIELNLSGDASDEAVCATPDTEDGTLNKVLADCNAAPTDDYAERYPTAADVTYGDIVVPGSTMITTNGKGAHGVQQIVQAVRSTTPYQGPVYGIVSNNYGDFTSAGNNIADADRPMPVALVGRVPVKVVAEGGAIAIGDFLTTSSTPGAAMKATQAGRVIGMALANWDGASSTVMVQVVNTWYQPPVSESSSLQGGSSNAVVVADSVSASDASFEGSVTIAEHLYGSRDMAGRIRMASQETSVRVTFETPYGFQPIVTFSSRSNSLDAREAWVSNEDVTGFTLNRPESTSDSQVEFNWISVGVEDAQVTVSDLNGGFVQISVNDENGPSAPAPVVVEEEPAPAPAEESAPAPAEEPAPAPAEEPVL